MWCWVFLALSAVPLAIGVEMISGSKIQAAMRPETVQMGDGTICYTVGGCGLSCVRR